jgi:hypothetical protein
VTVKPKQQTLILATNEVIESRCVQSCNSLVTMLSVYQLAWAKQIKIDTCETSFKNEKVNKILYKVFEILVWQSPRPIFVQKWQLVAKSSLRFAISKYKSTK